MRSMRVPFRKSPVACALCGAKEIGSSLLHRLHHVLGIAPEEVASL
ncbi:hypothetical protein FB480_10392 [Agrobacterium vitis]|nr:hypothetical protein FB480_10392 [Agrobacterium vitis]